MLDLTPKEIMEKRHITINPCKTCEPVGAMFCALGVENCMPHSHGSQGCCSYHRTVLSRHFKEPALASSSSFTEGASVFGGRSNINTAVKNIFDLYDPDIIAIHTTCLSETIGDDVGSYILDMEIPDDKKVLFASTPSYEGSHIQGFSNMVIGFMKYLTKKTGTPNGKTAIFPGWVNPGDDRELKRIAALMGADYIYFPDHDGTLDHPMDGKNEYFHAHAGTSLADMEALGDCVKLISMGTYCSQEPSDYMKRQFATPYANIPLPVGVALTDRYVTELRKVTKQEVPKVLEDERGRLLDLMLDSHQYTYKKKVAIYGDPDIVYAFTSLCLELSMCPKYIITGTPKESWVKEIRALMSQYGVDESEYVVKADTDLFYLHQLIKNEGVDLLLGSSYGKQIAKAEDIPMVRMGFPVLDRYGNPIQASVGYAGGIRYVEKIVDAMMDRQDRDALDEDFDVVM
ncbi:nitrogenase component 1 [Lacrimispora indolis]|uniref:nitrogenase component 1 n=1 Tax=Lacrimispora indolis TaxID=69825 RepID=UPI0003F8219B|nr:nitrogenase component 1 [[Clostridium] methoxybenzovorans]